MFVLFIKEQDQAERMYGYHLGTVEREARSIVEQRWSYRVGQADQYEWLRLEVSGSAFDTFSGSWASAAA